MILDIPHRFCFIHIPRTGGKLITHLLQPLLTLDGFLGGGCLRHIPAKHVSSTLHLSPELYNKLWKFTVYRPVDEVKESMKRLIQYDIKKIEETGDTELVVGSWKAILDVAKTDGYDKAIELIWNHACWPHEEEKWKRFWICDEFGKEIIDTVYEYSKDNFSFIIKDIMRRVCPDVGAK